MDESANKKRKSNYIVDFGTLFFRVLSHWRSILLWALIFAVAFTAFRSLTGGKITGVGERESVDQIYQSASDELAALDSQRAQLESIRDYRQHSLTMGIEPWNEHVRETVFAVRVEKDGAPGAAGVLAGAYACGLDLSAVAEELGVDSRYMDGLVQTSVAPAGNGESVADSSGSIRFAGFCILVIGDSDELTARITDIIRREIKEMEEELSGSVAAHTVEPISERAFTRIDRDLLWMQTEIRQRSLDLQTGVEELEASFRGYVNTLEKELHFNTEDSRSVSALPPHEQMEFLARRLETGTVSRDGAGSAGIIKNFIIGGILGAILMAGVWILACMFGSGFETADEFFTRYGLTRLGVFAPDRRELGLRRTALDRKILSYTGDFTGLDEKKTMELAAAAIGNLLGEGQSLMVTGTASTEKIQSLGRELTALLPGRKIVIAPDFLDDAQAIRALQETDAVVLTEERSASAFGRIDGELSCLDRMNKEILGAFIV